MAPKTFSNKNYNVPSGLQNPNPQYIISKRAPTTLDKGYEIGTIWVDTAGSSSYQLVSIINGVPTWADLAGISAYPITPYVVGPIGKGGYQTIQSAINAATIDGGGIVYIQPGTYTENLTMTENIYLVGMIGSDGNAPISVPAELDLPVIISGNLTLNLTAATVTPTVEFKNIQFTSTSGVIISYAGNLALLESAYMNFDNCKFIASATTTAIFFNDGFFNMTLQSCVVDESVSGTADFIQWGTTPFLNLNVRDSYVLINAADALVVPTGSFNVFALQNSFWAARMDVSAGTQSMNFTAYQCVFNQNPVGVSDPLINFGGNAGSFFANYCLNLSAKGSFADSTSAVPSDVFRYNYCIWNNPLTLGTNGRGDFSFCEFYGDTNAALTFSSSRACSLISSIIRSTNNPAIAGAGAGVLTIGDITFIGNSSIAGTLTIASSPSLFGTTTLRGNLTFNNAGNKIISTNVATTTAAGANSFGSVVLAGGTATVSTTSVTANSLIKTWRQSVGATGAAALGQISVGTIVAGTSFVINSLQPADATALQVTDVSRIGWEIIN